MCGLATLDYNIVADRMLTDYEGLDKWFKPEVTMKLNIKPIEGLSYSQTLGYENRQRELHPVPLSLPPR